MSKLGSELNPLRVAIVGSGPSGFYALDYLLKSNIFTKVDMFDSLPTPYGLLRGGVAPDHQKMKTVAKYYERVAVKNADNFNFFGNVTIGKDITIDELRNYYDAIIFSYGASSDRLTGLKGESLKGIHSAREFVAWYNGHPDFTNSKFDLTQENVIIIGQGNVAVDVARILGKTVDELAVSDIPNPVIEQLAESKVKNIYMIGRRTVVQAAFTKMEIEELGHLADCDICINPKDLILSPANQIELEDSNKAQKNYQVLEEFAKNTNYNKSRKIILKFLYAPLSFLGSSVVSGMEFENVQLQGDAFKQNIVNTGEYETIQSSLIFRSIGYKGTTIDGLPFDDKKGVIYNDKGQVLDASGNICKGLFTSGWIKRGPSGVIGTNKPDSGETVETLLNAIETFSPAKFRHDTAMNELLKQKNIQHFTFDDWLKIDKIEVENGNQIGKPREKFTSVESMLKVINTVSST